MEELVEEGDIVIVTSNTLKHPVTIKINWEK